MPTISQRLRHIIGDSFGASIVEQTLEKALQDAKERASAPTSQFYDPMSLFMGREWLTRQGNTSIGPTDLRAMAQNPIIGSIIQTRINQVAAFCVPFNHDFELGYEIRTEDNEAKADTSKANALRDWIYTSGMVGYGEDSLETFARKFMRDSLILDQACAEIIPRRNKQPAYMVAIDAATIVRLKASLDYATPNRQGEPLYAQIMMDTIVNRYSKEQLIFGVRNPQTDIRYQGYGMSELEVLIRVVATILNTERYNNGQLTQGGTSKGVLVVKGDGIDDPQYESFKRDFREAVRNAAAYWRPPVLKMSKDAQVDWVALDRSNRDMEYAALFDFLVKQACGVYQIDPSEINWNLSGSAGTKTNFESGTGQKFLHSHQKGLKPLLTFLATQLNTNIVQRIDPRYRMEFVGLDQDRLGDTEIYAKEVATYKTVNELRKDLSLPSLGPAGDILLNDAFMKALEMQSNTAGTGTSAPPKEETMDVDPSDPELRDVDINADLEQ